MSIKDYLLNEVGPVNRPFEKVVKEIAKATDNNEHTISLLLLAEYLKSKDYVDIFKGIDMIHMAYGSMTSELNKVRDKAAREIYSLAEQKLEKSEYNKLMAAY